MINFSYRQLPALCIYLLDYYRSAPLKPYIHPKSMPSSHMATTLEEHSMKLPSTAPQGLGLNMSSGHRSFATCWPP